MATPRPQSPPDLPERRFRYLSYLPAVYSETVGRSDAQSATPEGPFLGRFLWGFEDVLGPVERMVDNLFYYFDLRVAPKHMLPLLAQWVGIELDEAWQEERMRETIRRTVNLHRARGLLGGLAEALELYTGIRPEITPGPPPGGDMESNPYHFYVRFRLIQGGLTIDRSVAEAIIRREKPAHTTFTLDVVTGG